MAAVERCNFLILDDEALILLDLEYAVEEAGYAAVTAMNCEEALALLAGGTIATAIVDVSLGRGCTCEPVVRDLVAREIPYILHTGDIDRLDEGVRDLGGVLVSKPTPAAIVVRRALAQIEAHSRI